MRKRGFHVEPWDIKFGAHFGLLQKEVERRALSRIRDGEYSGLWFGNPCTSPSRACKGNLASAGWSPPQPCPLPLHGGVDGDADHDAAIHATAALVTAGIEQGLPVIIEYSILWKSSRLHWPWSSRRRRLK